MQTQKLRKKLYSKDLLHTFDVEATKRGYPVDPTDDIILSILSVLLMLIEHCQELESKIQNAD